MLTADQGAAVAAVGDSLGRFGAFLLHGVTGSGKTEVYLRLIERVLASGRGALVLVPEIALTPQLVARFRERLAAPVVALHSSLADGARLEAWRAARSGSAPVVIGTRSAVFTPMPALGLVVVDEEHDASYKQQEGFRYSGRDLALMRAQRAGVPAVLGSATPSLESLANAAAGRYATLSLPERTGRAGKPRVTVVDLRVHACARRAVAAGDGGDRAPPRRPRAGARVPEPPRLRADDVLQRLRLDGALQGLRRAAHRAPRPARGSCAITAGPRRRCPSPARSAATSSRRSAKARNAWRRR